jgi:hypothetical protein
MITTVTGSTDCEIGVARLIYAYVTQLPNKPLASRGKIIMTRAMAIVDAVETSEINLDANEGTAKERGTRIFDSVYPLPSQAGRGASPRSNLGRPPPRPSQRRQKSKRLAPSEVGTDPDPPPREGATTQLALTDGTGGGDYDDSIHSLSEAEVELPRLNAANAVAKRRRTDPIDVEPASDEESIPYEQPASEAGECESCDDDFEGIIPRKWKGEHKTRKLEMLAKILEVSAAKAAGMLASAAGRATDGGGDWNASVHMIAMQAAVDYDEAKARCRSRIPALDLDNDPDDCWQHALKKMFAMKPSQAAPKGARENAPPCNHAKIVGVSSEPPRYLGAATAADIDVLTSAEAFRAERESAPDEYNDHDRIKLALVIHGAAGWCLMYSNGFARDRSGSQKVPATLVTTCARLSTTIVRMIKARRVGDSTKLFQASIKKRESARRGAIMGIFELAAIVIALGGRVPEENAIETSGPGETPFEQGELGSMRPETLSSCVEQALTNLEELIYYAHVKVGGAIDYGSASKLGLVKLWKRTFSRFKFEGRTGHCGRDLIELALRKLGEAIQKKRTEATTDPLDLSTPVQTVSSKEFDEVAANVRFEKYATSALASAAATGIAGDNTASAARKRPVPKTSAAPPLPQHAAKWAKHEHCKRRERPEESATSARTESTQQAAQAIVYSLEPNTILRLLPTRNGNKPEPSAIHALETLIKEKYPRRARSPARGIGLSDHASPRRPQTAAAAKLKPASRNGRNCAQTLPSSIRSTTRAARRCKINSPGQVVAAQIGGRPRGLDNGGRERPTYTHADDTRPRDGDDARRHSHEIRDSHTSTASR